MDPITAWIGAQIAKIKVYMIIYFFLLILALLYAIIVYYTAGNVELSSETFTTNGVYVLESSFWQRMENILFGNIQETLSRMRKAIVFNDIFRAIVILVAILAITLMGFTMLIGDQKITIKEFFSDILLIFGSASILLYYDPTLSVDPSVPAQPEKYITLLYNFLQSISQFFSTMLFGSVDGYMSIKYTDGSPVGYYAPLDVVTSLFTDKGVSERFKLKLAALILSPAFVFVPLVLIATLYFLLPCILTVFVAILLAKVTIMFTLQFVPFFILFASINDVKIRISKKSKGLNYLGKIIITGLAEPLVFLALTSFVAGFLFYIFVVINISDIFDFSISTRKVDLGNNEHCEWYDAPCLLKKAAYSVIEKAMLPITSPQGFNFTKFFFASIQLIAGIKLFEHLFGKITAIIGNLVSGGAAGKMINSGKGLFDKKDNDIGKMVDSAYQKNMDWAINKTMGSDTRTDEEKKEKPDDKEKTGLVYGFVQKHSDAASQAIVNKIKPHTDAAKSAVVNKIKKAFGK